MSEAASKTKKRPVILDRYTFYPGRTVFNEGETGDCAYIIESGMVEITKTEGHRELLLGTLGQGAIFGEMSLIDNSPRMASARALEQTVVIMIQGDAFRKKIKEADPFISGLLRVLVGHLRSVTDRTVKMDYF